MYRPFFSASWLNLSTDTVPDSDSYATTVLTPRPFHLSKLQCGWLHTPITNGCPPVDWGVGAGGGDDDGGVTGLGAGATDGSGPLCVGIVDGSAAFTVVFVPAPASILLVPPADCM